MRLGFTSIFVSSYFESPDILRSGGYCPFECFGHIMIMDFAISTGCDSKVAVEEGLICHVRI